MDLVLFGTASFAVVVPIRCVVGSIGLPNGSYCASDPCRVPPKLATTMSSPCRSGRDHAVVAFAFSASYPTPAGSQKDHSA